MTDFPADTYRPTFTRDDLRRRIGDLSDQIADAKVAWTAAEAAYCALRTEDNDVDRKMAYRKLCQLRADLQYVRARI